MKCPAPVPGAGEEAMFPYPQDRREEYWTPHIYEKCSLLENFFQRNTITTMTDKDFARIRNYELSSKINH